MDFIFKTSESNVIESWDLVLRIVLKVCESDMVSAIGSFQFRGEHFVIRAPDIRGYDYIVDTGEDWEYELMSGPEAIDNKLAGLYLLKAEDSRKVKFINETEIEPGLNGIRKAIICSKSLYQGSKFFDFSIPVIWEMDKKTRMYNDCIFNEIDNEKDSISGICHSKESGFGFYSRIEDNLENYNELELISYLNKIQKILDDVESGKFEVRPQFNRIDLLQLGVLVREEGEFHSIDDNLFKEALNRYHQESYKRSQEETRMIMQRVDEDIAKYKEKALVDVRAKQKYERLQEMKRVMEAFGSYTNLEEKTSESENEDKSD